MFNWLTGFLMNPALALGGLAVASPILIHLLSRRRYRRIQWAAMSFLLEARKQNRRRIRLQQWILLALRCLAVLLIAAAVARPFVSTASLGGLLAGRGKTEHLLLLDDSYSMGYRASDGKTVFQAACHAVRQRVRRLAADAPFDMVSLYLTSRPQQPLAALASISPVEVRRLEDLLDTLSPSQRTARFDEACAALAETIRRSASQANVHLCVVSDFQRSDWMPRDRGAVSPAGAPLIALQEQRPDLRLTLIDVAAASPANLAITDVTMPHARVAVDVPTRVEVEVANHSTVAVDTLVLSVESGDRVLPPVILSRLGAGQTLREPIEVTLPVVGPGFLRVRLAGEAASRDGLSLDNARAVAVDVLPAVRVLLVNGAPDSDPFRDEAHLLRTALNPAGRVASGFEVVTMSASEVDAAEWDAFSAVLLANVGRISLDARQNLERFVASGGGLIVFCGDMIDIDHYNREWYRDGNGPLPAAFQEVHSAPVGSEPFEFGAWDEAHPLMRHFTGALVHRRPGRSRRQIGRDGDSTRRPDRRRALQRPRRVRGDSRIAIRPRPRRPGDHQRRSGLERLGFESQLRPDDAGTGLLRGAPRRPHRAVHGRRLDSLPTRRPTRPRTGPIAPAGLPCGAGDRPARGAIGIRTTHLHARCRATCRHLVAGNDLAAGRADAGVSPGESRRVGKRPFAGGTRRAGSPLRRWTDELCSR
jgi:hypothetical protein